MVSAQAFVLKQLFFLKVFKEIDFMLTEINPIRIGIYDINRIGRIEIAIKLGVVA
jgi:hypothetical protein